MDREKFLASQAISIDYTFSFTANEEAARAQFEQLAIDTYDFLVSEAAPAWGPSSVFQAYSSRPYLYRRDLQLPPQLEERWNDWAKEYEVLCARNPQLELRDAMHRISESHDASSWPSGLEGRIEDWIKANDSALKPPFDDRHGMVTPAFYQRLRELRELCGGWLY